MKLFVDLLIFIGGVFFGMVIMSLAAIRGKESMCEECLHKKFDNINHGDKK